MNTDKTDMVSYFLLIDAMAGELSLPEAGVVITHQVPAGYLPQRWAEGLRDDIFRGLSSRFAGSYEAYGRYLDICCGGRDPMDSPGQTALMMRLAEGTDETTYYHLLPVTFYYLSFARFPS